MEVLSALSILITLWNAGKALYRWWLQRQHSSQPIQPIQHEPQARDFLLSYPELDTEKEHLRFITRYSLQVMQSKYGEGR